MPDFLLWALPAIGVSMVVLIGAFITTVRSMRPRVLQPPPGDRTPD